MVDVIGFLTTPWILGVILTWILYALYVNVWNKKDNIVFCFMHDLIDGTAHLKSTKPVKGKLILKDGVRYLKLPKRWSSTDLPGVEHEHFIPNSKGLRILNLLCFSPEKYLIIKPKYDVKEQYGKLKLIDNGNAFWTLNEMQAADIRNKVYDKYAWMKANGVAIVMLMVAFMTLVYSMNYSRDMIKEANGEAREQTKQILDQVTGLKDYLTGGENNINAEVPNNSNDKPPGIAPS